MSSCLDSSIRAYLDDAAAAQPTPGGGSVSALVGAVGASMAQMAANFTLSRKKFADVHDEVAQLLDAVKESADELLSCMDDDVAAYAGVSEAYGLPRKTDGEKTARTDAIQNALVTAMEPPMRIARACNAIAARLGRLARIANPMLISDVGVAAALIKGALFGARLNVDINLLSLKDVELKSRTTVELNSLMSEARLRLDEAYGYVALKLGDK